VAGTNAFPNLPFVVWEVARNYRDLELAEDEFFRLAFQEELKRSPHKLLWSARLAGQPLVGIAGHIDAMAGLAVALGHGYTEGPTFTLRRRSHVYLRHLAPRSVRSLRRSSSASLTSGVSRTRSLPRATRWRWPAAGRAGVSTRRLLSHHLTVGWDHQPLAGPRSRPPCRSWPGRLVCPPSSPSCCHRSRSDTGRWAPRPAPPAC
jgi:hypothetical protein